MNWKLLDSKKVFDNFIKIEQRTYEMPDGKIKNFDILTSLQAVCILALTTDNKIIIVEQFRPGPSKVLNEIPGGLIDEDELPEEAAARELLEETGYAGELEFVTKCFDSSSSTMHRSCFVARNCKRVAEQQLDDGEFINVKLMKIDEFLKIVRAGEMTDVEVAYLGLDRLGLLTVPA